MTKQPEPLPDKFDLRSMDVTAEKRAELLRLFPEVATEGGKVDFERLRLALGEQVDGGRERYGLTWPGKAECFRTIQRPSLATLRPRREESVEFDTTQNLILEGDNLEVLKLLQKSYLGKVKMIYIDPPYNTGNDFIYPDNYTESLQTYLEYTGQVDAEGKKWSTNTEADGRFHSKWLNMMYPRLYLARNLLREDGVIFISIDDHELENLRRLCDDILGEENFVATVIWQKVYSPKNSARHFSEDHDYVVVFARNAEAWSPNLLPRSEEATARYDNPDNDSRGPWKAGDPTARNYYSEGQYEVTSPTGRKFRASMGSYWRFKHSRFVEMDKDNRIWWGKTGDNMPAVKRFLSEVKQGVVAQTLWKYEDVGHTQDAKKQLLEHVGFESTDNVLDTVKPIQLLQRMLLMATQPTEGDIVVDFFAGSGSTAHAVLEQNKEDAGNRKFVLVQLPEPLPMPESKLRTIADITKERVRRVIKNLNDADKGQLPLNPDQKPDRGFRVFQLTTSNFKPWDGDKSKDATALKQQLLEQLEHILPDRNEQDLLYEILLKDGLTLTTPIETLTIAGKKVYSIEGGVLLLCLEDKLTLDLIRALADKKPSRVVCLDRGFHDNDQLKTNAAKIFATKGVEKFKTV